MSDADGRIIPLVEDDQGEGIKDFCDSFDDLLKTKLQEESKKAESEREEVLYLLRTINQRLLSMDAFINYVFGHHVLIDGKFKDLKLPRVK